MSSDKPASGLKRIAHARARLRQSAVRRQLEGVVSGTSRSLTFDLRRSGDDAVIVIRRQRLQGRWGRAEVTRLAAAFNSAGVLDAVVDGLLSQDGPRAVLSARMAGALELERAVDWLEPLLMSDEPAVVEAAARALGRIRGTRAAEALLGAVQRRGPRRVFVAELARSAPDLFLESVLSSRRRAGVHTAAAIAAGLRRRQVATAPLLGLLTSGSRRQRAIGCRALGWIGARTAIPLLEEALGDREAKVRASAAKALVAMHRISA